MSPGWELLLLLPCVPEAVDWPPESAVVPEPVAELGHNVCLPAPWSLH